ncbi:acetate--CoA ligase [Intrasporangium calvum]|uniref:Propionyl-CoA synthetase n=1 Tax=Intrasporangium calvum (strain ATCC 23552 / DSM 43043 / JCM 3097 / NBRC 12989 / NCIMB 10167 / NRRL B-3866 / 7 KIP) TaxID=710696 RepID=E6SEY2_INTC7|nr:acetate--CoA ligase [Intrasporangium calvum]ADU48771.1 propionyl-CoA synthetase [Intrasporangium calvum DSM 43043]
MSDGASPAAYPLSYRTTYEASLTDPDGFWAEAANLIDWVTPPTRILDADNPPFYRWYPDGELNVCHNAVDRHVAAGRGDQPAIHYDSPVTGTKETITYAALLARVRAVAGGLRGLGVEKGDRVVIYMPMVPEAVIAMLACARIGAIHSVVFGGFAPQELAARIDDAAPKVILSASCGIEPTRVVTYKPFLDEAIHRSEHKPEACVILQRPQERAELGERDVDWEEFESGAAAQAGADPVTVAATDPLYILYTSGTTGKPKGIYRDSGGYAVALRWSMEKLYDVQPGETMFTASDVGWVVGHSYIVYGPLLTGATTVLYEGKPIGTPDAGAFWRVISEYDAVCLFTAPTAFRAIKKEDASASLVKDYDLSRFRTLYLAGERLDPDTYEWASAALGVPVIDNWWQTETGWPIACNPKGIEMLPIKPGSPTVAVPGYDVQVLDGEGNQMPPGQEGAICIKLPMPPGTLPTLWQDDERYVSSYLSAYPGYYLTGDGGYCDDDGYLFVMGRTDDVLNVAGHRLSTGSIEAALAGHEAVAECAVIGVHDELKGQVPRALVVLKSGIDGDAEGERIRRELVARVRSEVGAVAALHQVDIVPGLPKTRSGKILRKTMREIADGGSPAVPATIEDASVLEQLGPVLRGT